MPALLRRLRDETGSTRPLAVVRIGLGLLLLERAWHIAGDLASGWMGDRFRWPALPDALVAPRPVWIALAGALVLLALLVAAGRFARPALLLSALLHLYALLADRLVYHHHRYALVLACALLAFTPCDRLLVLGRARRDPIGPLWAQRLLQAQVSILYLASGISKLAGSDWRSGRVIADGFARFGPVAIARGVPDVLVARLGEPAPSQALALAAIATELLLAVGLWSRRARPYALWWGLLFHLAIQVTTSVAIFSWLMILLYALFALPDEGARTLRYDPARPAARAAARLVSALDWLGRFTLVAEPGAALLVVDRDGRELHGPRTLTALARALPLLFPLWLPLRFAVR